MPGIGIAILLMMLLAAGAVWTLFLALTIFAFWKNKFWLKLVAGVPLSLMTLGGMLIVVIGVKEYLKSTSPEGTFASTFHFEPPAGTVIHRGSYEVMFDSGTADLIFQSDPQTISRISTNGFQEISRSDFIELAPNDMWDEVHASNRITGELVFLRRSNFGSFQTHDEALLVVNTNTGLVFFHWSGID